MGFSKVRKDLDRGILSPPPTIVLVMEYFTRILKKMSIKHGFAYHYRCSSLKITHLIFVDDLMMFCKGEVKLVVFMTRALKAFSQASVFSANINKFALYFGNVLDELQTRILQVTNSRRAPSFSIFGSAHYIQKSLNC